MKKLGLLTIFCFFQLYTATANAGKELDSLLNVLDKSVLERDFYTKQKIHVINELEAQCNQSDSEERKFIIYGQLFEEYKNFQMDSAHVIAQKRNRIAEKKDHELFGIITSLNHEVMIVTGMYKEALDLLNGQPREKYTEEEIKYSYHLYHSLYMLMSEYSFSNPEKEYYRQLEYAYKDSILSVLNPSVVGYQLVLSSKLLMEDRWDEALEVAGKTYLDHREDNRIAAMITHTIADIYAAKKDTLNIKKYLTLSSIYDMRSGVKEYMSLPELATFLYHDNDINRAYAYMKCSLEDAIFCKARLRALELSRMLPIINATYDIKMKAERDRLVLFLVIIIVLAGILIISLFIIYKKLKELAAARQLLKNTNEHLKQINTDLQHLNEELSESDHVKEEYISYVFTMCSEYIDKLDNFRKRVNQKIKGGQTDDLYRETKSGTFVNDELKEFYKSFDTVFLSIYPDFIDDFNSLLHDEEHIRPKEGELLTPELRIYALVRLGIGDSVKIAGFLHYSPQTVYNYRLKVRNKAKISKEKFPEAVKQLGQMNK